MTRSKRTPRRDAGRARGAPIEAAILSQTLAELATAGFEGLNVERIARRAEVNKTSVYRRWPTREALITAALEGVLDDVSSKLPDSGSLRTDLLALLSAVSALAGHATGRALVRAAIAESSQSSVATMAARRLKQRSSGGVRAVVERARQRGEWRDGASAGPMVSALVGAVIHRAMLEHGALTKRWLGSLADVVLLGVMPRGERGGRTVKRGH